MNFLQYSDEEYVLMCDCNAIYNFDLTKMFAFHEEKGADITVAYVNGETPNIHELAILGMDEDNKINAVSRRLKDGVENYSINIVLLRKSLLERLVNEATSLGYRSFTDDILKRNVSKLKIYGYEAPGFVKMLDSMQTYFEANMALLNKANRDALCREHHVYTKVKDDVPAIYGLGSDVSNSLIADGCVIEGKVENCILFRGVHIGKGTVVKNCVLMQNTYIGDDVSLNCVVADKNVVIKPGKVLSGDEKFPVYIGKSIVI